MVYATCSEMRCHISVGVVTGYGLGDTSWTAGNSVGIMTSETV